MARRSVVRDVYAEGARAYVTNRPTVSEQLPGYREPKARPRVLSPTGTRPAPSEPTGIATNVAASLFAEARAKIEEHATSLEGRLKAGLSLEEFLEDSELCDIPLSVVQRALVRAIDGKPLGGLLDEDQCGYHFGCDEGRFENYRRPREIVIRKGRAAGGTRIAVLAALYCAFVADLSKVPRGERVIIPIVAPQLDLTKSDADHLRVVVMGSPMLSRYVSIVSTNRIDVRRWDGQVVHIEMKVASFEGKSLRGVWIPAVVFDEADFHGSRETAIINLPAQLTAIRPRVISNGGQIFIVSSPHAEGTDFDKFFQKAWGQPGRTLAFHSDTLSMNPSFDATEIEEQRRENPEEVAREFDAVPLLSGSHLFFTADWIRAVCVLEGPIEPNGKSPRAGVDHGFRKNSSAVAISQLSDDEQVVEVAYAEEHVPKPREPLKPRRVMKRFGEICQKYGATSMLGDEVGSAEAEETLADLPEALPDVGRKKIKVVYERIGSKTDKKHEAYTTVRDLGSNDKLRLPNSPRLKAQLQGVRWRADPGGRIKIVLGTKGQAHSDLLEAVVLSAFQLADQVSGYDQAYRGTIAAQDWDSGTTRRYSGEAEANTNADEERGLISADGGGWGRIG